MTATPEQAENEILTVIKGRWDVSAPLHNDGVVPRVEYDNIEQLTPPAAASECWMRVSVQHTGVDGLTLGGAGARLFTRLGLVSAQVFTPQGEGKTRALRLAKIVNDAMQGEATPSGVWFRDVRIVQVGPSNPWFQVNVLAEFRYDERN